VWVVGEVKGAGTAVVAQLGVEVAQLGPGFRDLLGGGQAREPLVELLERAVEPLEPAALSFEFGCDRGSAGTGTPTEGGADGGGLLAFEALDPPNHRCPLARGAIVFGVDVRLLLDRFRREVAQGGPPVRGELGDLGGDGLLCATASEPTGQIWDVVEVDVMVQPVVSDADRSVVELVRQPAAGHRDVAPLAVEGLGAQRVGVLASEPLRLVARCSRPSRSGHYGGCGDVREPFPRHPPAARRSAAWNASDQHRAGEYGDGFRVSGR
jgi:hypothetical protein